MELPTNRIGLTTPLWKARISRFDRPPTFDACAGMQREGMGMYCDLPRVPFWPWGRHPRTGFAFESWDAGAEAEA